MSLLNYFDFNLSQFLIILFIVFIASIIRGFNGFGFSATCISGFSFILAAAEIVPIILILEVIISIFMIPYIWNKIDWNFVFKLLILTSCWVMISMDSFNFCVEVAFDFVIFSFNSYLSFLSLSTFSCNFCFSSLNWER
jgi:uncharacterized membrane protein YfcA